MVEISKIDVGSIPYKTVQIEGVEVKVYKWIPYEKKQEFILEYVESQTAIDFDNGVAYKAPCDYATRYYLLAKYYTNIDVSLYEDYMGELFDTIRHQENEVFEFAYDDISLLMQMCEDSVRAVIEQYNAANSLAQKVKMSLKGILDGGDISEAIAKNQSINDQMIEMIKKANSVPSDENKILFPWAAKKND